MRFRDATKQDTELLRGLSAKIYDKLPAPADAEESFVWCDDNGIPRINMQAQKVAEIYMVMDHEWETPAMRWAAIEQCYREMRIRLEQKGYHVAYSFFPDGVPNGYARRLAKLLGMERVLDRCMRIAR